MNNYFVDETNKILCINNEGNLSIIHQDKFGKHWQNKLKTIYGYIKGDVFDGSIIFTKKTSQELGKYILTLNDKIMETQEEQITTNETKSFDVINLKFPDVELDIQNIIGDAFIEGEIEIVNYYNGFNQNEKIGQIINYWFQPLNETQGTVYAQVSDTEYLKFNYITS